MTSVAETVHAHDVTFSLRILSTRADAARFEMALMQSASRQLARPAGPLLPQCVQTTGSMSVKAQSQQQAAAVLTEPNHQQQQQLEPQKAYPSVDVGEQTR